MNDAIDTGLDLKRNQLEKVLDNKEFLELEARFYRRFWEELLEVGFSEKQALAIIGGK